MNICLMTNQEKFGLLDALRKKQSDAIQLHQKQVMAELIEKTSADTAHVLTG
jgi:hypothetical protein